MTFDPVAEALAPWKVEDYLNATDYQLNPNYVPSEFALEFVTFIKLVNGQQGEEHKTPLVHYRMLDTLTQGGKRVINLCHRGIAKTTVMGEYLFLFVATYGEIPGFGRIDLALYVSDSIENGVKNMRKNLEFRWDNSDFLKQYVPEIRFTDIRWEFKNADGKVFIVKGYGAKTGVRGAKEMGKRPQLAVLDDLISDEDARSTTVIAAVEDTVYKAVNYALHPTKNMIIWSGTPFNAKDPLYKAVESGAWAVNVFPVCEQFPCERSEFRGSWPDRFTFDYVKEQYDNAVKLGKVETFNQELMLRIMSEEDRMIQDGDIGWYKIDAVLRNKSKFNFYITTDFATSLKDKADFSVRFNTVVPLFKARKVFFPIERKQEDTMLEAMNELSLVSVSGFRSKHDDFLDTISMLSSLNPWKPSEEAPMVESGKGEGMWDIDTGDEPIDRMASYIV
jgi:hypothetical protein